MSESPSKNINVKIPLIIFSAVAAIVLVTFLFTRGVSNQPEPTATQDAEGVGTEEVETEADVAPGRDITPDASEETDPTQFERRDPEDVLTAGPIDAPVGLIVFSDYQCPFCAQWSHETLPTMMEFAERGELRIEWRDLNVFGPESERASLAAYAAALQNHFWEYHEALYPEGQKLSTNELTEEALIELAGALGLDTEQFATDMTSVEARAEIVANQQLGFELGAASTPVFLLGGVPIAGAQPTEVFVQAFEDALQAQG